MLSANKLSLCTCTLEKQYKQGSAIIYAPKFLEAVNEKEYCIRNRYQNPKTLLPELHEYYLYKLPDLVKHYAPDSAHLTRLSLFFYNF
jgi:hypothetical protein